MRIPLHKPCIQLGLNLVLLISAITTHATELAEGAPEQQTESSVVTAESVTDADELSETEGNAESAEPDSQPQELIDQLPKAENIDLSDPVVEPAEIEAIPAEPQVQSTPPAKTAEIEAELPIAEPQPFVILNNVVERGTTTRLSWSPDQSFQGIATPTPVLIAHGLKEGPKLCLTAAVHGDELNGIEIVRSVMYDIDPKELNGTVIAVPIVNLQGFRRGSRYLTDRRDLNRFFPGNPGGSSASRIAYSFFEQVITHCDLLVDLHTGSFFRTNLPQLRANTLDPQVVELTQAFDAIAVLHSEGAVGTLRRAAVDAGIPAVTLEAGGPMELNESYVAQGVKAINTLLDKMNMLDTISFWGTPQPTYYSSLWVRANQGGILFSDIKLGARVRKGSLLGTVTDPITNVRSLILSPVNGRILGMAVNQVVLPGFAAYHIGIDPDSSQANKLVLPVEADSDAQDNDEEEEEEAGFDEFD